MGMTREYIARKIDLVDSIMQSHFNDYGEETHRALQEAVKLIEQELKTDVLDKIRAEITNLEEGISSYHNDRPLIFKNEVLEIIDKYKAESEVEE